MNTQTFRFEYNFKINDYISGVSLIEASYSAPLRSKTSKIAMMLPTKIGVEKMQHIIKMRCERDLELTKEQKEFIKSRTVKVSDPSVFESRTEEDFDKLFEDAQKAHKEQVKKLPPKDAYPQEFARLIKAGASEGAAKKIVSLSCKGEDVLEMNNAVYCADINGVPKLIEKFYQPGLGLFAYNIHISIRAKAKENNNG